RRYSDRQVQPRLPHQRPPNRHPATTRTSRLRSHVICDLCGRRLYGKTRRVGDGYSYYACEPVPAHHAGKDWYASHPKSLWVREDKLIDAVRGFFHPPHHGTAARIILLRGKIRELERQQTNVVKELREYKPIGDEDIDQQWRDQLRASFAE